MGKTTANLYKLSDRAFAIVGDDGLDELRHRERRRRLGVTDRRRISGSMDEIDDALTKNRLPTKCAIS